MSKGMLSVSSMLIVLANLFLLAQSVAVFKDDQKPKPVGNFDETNGLDQTGTNVCTYRETITRLFNESYLSQRFTVEYYTTCRFFKCERRTRLATKTVISHRMVTKYIDRDVYHCCNGWKRMNKNSTSCDVPHCVVNCQNGGKCVAPNKCECKGGFSGTYCQLDNDECQDGSKNNCEQLCLNTKGGFRCACNQGYLLQKDGKSCIDIDECKVQSTCGCQGGAQNLNCTVSCVNTAGGYNCQCGKGFNLNSAGICQDINECQLDQTLCDQRCVNYEGGYHCQCFKGFYYDTKKKMCSDIDECASNKGGCSHGCVNTKGGYACTCPSGKYLSSDGRTCKDIDLNSKSETFCQSGSIGMLSCDDMSQKINITSVFYGRTSDKICQSGDFKSNLNCVDTNAIDNLRACNGMISCIVVLDMWKDPCPGIEKYATVNYKCHS